MIISLDRDIFSESATLSTLKIDGLDFGFCCEDTCRGLSQAQPIADVWRMKVPGYTCIPRGKYIIKRTWSNRFQKKMMQVLDVPGFQGIRIHPGNTSEDTEGCLLPGLSRDSKTMIVAKSRLACDYLDKCVQTCESRGEDVFLVIEEHRPS